MVSLLRYEDSFWPNVFVIIYVIASYFGGLLLMFSAAIALNIAGVFIFAHSMVVAAYLLHECAHNSLFRKNSYHRWLGELLLWICGCSYSAYEDVRHKHVRHHTDRADIVSFDYRERITAYPKLLKLIYFLEWIYVPAMEIVMHALVIILPFIKKQRKHRRFRVLFVLILRSILFVYLLNISISFLVFYPLAYMFFLIVMRFMDIHQHTYELYETLDSPRGPEARKRDREFEQKNTYSNLLSVKHPWVNLLVLNFPYHNAHHQQPGKTWYQLPALHKNLFEDDQTQVLSIKDLIKSYHRYRIPRILNEDEINLPVKQLHDKFIGVDGVSFLTTH